MNTQKELTPTTATSLRERLATRSLELVEVEPEKGFIYVFKKPNTMGIILGGALPQAAASQAAEA